MQHADRPVVKLRGDYDLSRREELREALYAHKDEDAIAIDLSEVRYMDSTGLGVLINLNKRFVLQGGPPLKLMNLQPRLQRLISITGLEKVFDIE
ncbi:MAG: anti-sigma factor antagonist RsbV [Vulcanimicrobiaceae bacterium]